MFFALRLWFLDIWGTLNTEGTRVSPKARSGSFFPRMRHGMTHEKDEMKDKGEEKNWRETRYKSSGFYSINLFPRVFARGNAAIKGEWLQTAIYARRDYIRQITGQITDEISADRLPLSGGQIEFITIDLLNYYRAADSARRGRSSKRNFCNCSIEFPARAVPASLLLSFNDHRIHCLDLETAGQIEKLAKVRRNVVERSPDERVNAINFVYFFFFA